LDAFYDLSQGNSLDWDESTVALIKEISERAEKAKQRQRKDEEKHRLEQLKREAAEKRRRQQEEEDRQQQQQQSSGGIEELFSHLKDPEIQALFKSNPALIQKVMKALSGDMAAAQDPEVQKVINKLQASFAGAAGGGPPPHPEAGHGHSHGHSHGDHSHGEHSHAEHSHAEHSHAEPGHSHAHKDDDDLD